MRTPAADRSTALRLCSRGPQRSASAGAGHGSNQTCIVSRVAVAPGASRDQIDVVLPNVSDHGEGQGQPQHVVARDAKAQHIGARAGNQTLNLGIKSPLFVRSLTAQKRAKVMYLGGLRRAILESEAARSNGSGPLWTPMDGRPAVFKTACGCRKAKTMEQPLRLRVWYHARVSLRLLARASTSDAMLANYRALDCWPRSIELSTSYPTFAQAWPSQTHVS
jgi:hypothetical protein